MNTNEGRFALFPGHVHGIPAGTGNAHNLQNETSEMVLYLEMGDRTPGEEVSYPDDDLEFEQVEGKTMFLHKDGTPY